MFLLQSQTWNKLQQNAIQSLTALIEGSFGCGKTTLLAAMTTLCANVGLHVLMVSPTNAGLQAIEKAIQKLNTLIPILRLLHEGIERRNIHLQMEKLKRFLPPMRAVIYVWSSLFMGSSA
jgi:predicted ATP-dependent serine protease